MSRGAYDMTPTEHIQLSERLLEQAKNGEDSTPDRSFIAACAKAHAAIALAQLAEKSVGT